MGRRCSPLEDLQQTFAAINDASRLVFVAEEALGLFRGMDVDCLVVMGENAKQRESLRCIDG